MKNYIKGGAKLVKAKFGELLNVSLNLSDLQRLPQYKGYVKLTIAPRKELGQFGDTHSIYEDDYHGNNEEDLETSVVKANHITHKK